ncbi:uncharacterized protein F4822DRAFT_270410 [Hypoxylon trugodes]|uniref:uncharacterized protein n=1 Tax=Hypoxylon trugodes TaxID=326681 RepID=UPI00219C6D29|nr:uncharacterized protein F4822DRAFT_270410 [Hypoxylon trugodes]KAI1389127.1 hypothetical protein F4822DRAFT_270410 [Hypoxylon trugodes]
MYSLFSRATQAQSSCRCRICLQPGRSILRRTTTAAPRRKVTAADLFTACYSTILGTAVVIDTHMKEIRKRELDEKLERARAAVEKLGIQDSSTGQIEEDYDLDLSSSNAPHGRRYDRRRKEPKPESATSILLQELAVLCETNRRPLPRSSWIQNQLDWVNIESAIVAEERDPYNQLREPRNVQQFEKTISATVDLVHQLVLTGKLFENVQNLDGDGTQGDYTRTEDRLEELKYILQSPYYPSYYHPSTNPEDTTSTRSLLGESIRHIFNQAGSYKDVVAKICYNILTSTATPSVHTYNTLIAGFNRIQRPDLAQTVIDSYLHRTGWPATEQTIVCLLTHYRESKGVDGFRDIIKRMRGVRDRGLNLRIVDKGLIYTENWLAWATESCASRKSAFVERARRSDDVFNCMVKGWLYCGQLGNACTAFVACLRDQSSVPIQTMQELFTTCLNMTDYQAARKLVRGFVKNFKMFMALVDRVVGQESIATSRQFLMSISHLVDLSWFPFEETFAAFTKTRPGALQTFKFYIDEACFELELREGENSFMGVIEALYSDGPLINRLQGAIDILDSARWGRQNVTKILDGLNRTGKILAVARNSCQVEEEIKQLTPSIKVTALKMKTGYDLDPSGLLTSKSPMNRCQRDRYDSLLNALEKIQICQGPMTQEDIKLQLIRHLQDAVLARSFENSGNLENLSLRALISLYSPKQRMKNKYENIAKLKGWKLVSRGLNVAEDVIKATLFAHLGGYTQSSLRFQYPDWYSMPLEKLVRCHLRRRLPKPSVAIDIEQTDAESHCEEALSTIVPPTTRSDGNEANNPPPRRRELRRLEMERRLRLGLPIRKNHSADPSLLRDENTPLTLPAWG